MPSTRKRIGYLPSINAQKTVTKIANKEKLSQSKVVGILVEEALIARCGFDLQNSNDLITNKFYSKRNDNGNNSFKYNDLDEMVSDKGITYNTKNHNCISEIDLLEHREKFNEELYEQFKQFILFQKMNQNK